MKKIISYNLLLSSAQSITNVLIILSFGNLFLIGNKSDAIFLSMVFPNFILLVWTSAIVNQITPFLVQYKLDGFNMNCIFDQLLKKLFFVILFVFISSFAAKKIIITYINNGSEIRSGVSISEMLNITLFYIPLQLFSVTLSSYYITVEKNIFVIRSFLLGNIFTICLIVLTRNYLSTIYLAYIILFGYLLTAIIFLIDYIFIKKNRKESSSIRIPFKSFFKNGIVLLIISFFTKSIAVYYSIYLANLNGGNISFYNYYQYGNNFLIAIAINPLLNIFYSKHSVNIEKNENDTLIFYFKLMKFIFLTFTIVTGILLLLFPFIIQLIQFYFTNIVLPKSIFVLILFSTLLLIFSALFGRILYLKKSVIVANLSDLISTIIFVVFLYFILPKYQLSSLIISFFILSLVNCIIPFLLLKYYIKFDFSISLSMLFDKNEIIYFITAIIMLMMIFMFDFNRNSIFGIILLTSIFYFNYFKRFINNIK
jgi:hypothetical protein